MEGIKRKRSDELMIPRITYHAHGRTFDRLFKEESLEEMIDVVRKKLDLPSTSVIKLAQIRDGKPIDLEDDGDFDAFHALTRTLRVADVQVSASALTDTVDNAASALQAKNATSLSTNSTTGNVSTPVSAVNHSASNVASGSTKPISRKKRRVSFDNSSVNDANQSMEHSTSKPKKQKSAIATEAIPSESSSPAKPPPVLPKKRKTTSSKSSTKSDAGALTSSTSGTVANFPSGKTSAGTKESIDSAVKKKKSKKDLDVDNSKQLATGSGHADIPAELPIPKKGLAKPKQSTSLTRKKPTKTLKETESDGKGRSSKTKSTASSSNLESSTPAKSKELDSDLKASSKKSQPGTTKTKPKTSSKNVEGNTDASITDSTSRPDKTVDRGTGSKSEKTKKMSRVENDLTEASSKKKTKRKPEDDETDARPVPKKRPKTTVLQDQPSLKDTAEAGSVADEIGKKMNVGSVQINEEERSVSQEAFELEIVTRLRAQFKTLGVVSSPTASDPANVEPSGKGSEKKTKPKKAATKITESKICLQEPFHVRYKCPIIIGGPSLIRKRLDELKQTGDDRHDTLIEELEDLIPPDADEETHPPMSSASQNNDITADADSISVNKSSLHFPNANGSHISEVTVESKGEGSSSESSDEEDSSVEEEKEKESAILPQNPTNLGLASMSDVDLEALIRGPVPAQSILDTIPTSDDDADEPAEALEEDDVEDRQSRRLSKRYEMDEESSEEEQNPASPSSDHEHKDVSPASIPLVERSGVEHEVNIDEGQHCQQSTDTPQFKRQRHR
ncbi:hypothetical protein BJ138DRAFT_624695 [Hygrophoropsis aurantiaca]|uniref:Uncharacterized protein n=1 Tax=Hygrophoropsis aurantiaca TaxID=72124 RepID=A0ACB8AKE7_9AGAM|nr:hypothetical protein BJ138DRAFT_624695 [Hygrophoropsis aurantiaca]